MLQAFVTEETNPKDSVEILVTEPTAEELHPREVLYDILPKESIAARTIRAEECSTDLSIQQSSSFYEFSVRHQFTLQDHGYGANVSCYVLVYAMALVT